MKSEEIEKENSGGEKRKEKEKRLGKWEKSRIEKSSDRHIKKNEKRQKKKRKTSSVKFKEKKMLGLKTKWGKDKSGI